MRYCLAMLLLAVMACTLTTTAPATELPEPLELPAENTAPIVTEEPADADPEVVNQPQSNTTTGTGSQPQPGQSETICTPRTDWVYTYRVISGDTLSNIATRAGSTAAALASGNCLTNADVISVGQVLRVPRPVTASLPATSLPPVGQPQPSQQGSVFISSYISADAGSYLLLRGETITLRWDNPPASLYRATFVVQNPLTGVQSQIAEDPNPSDGVVVSWNVPAGLQGSLFAIGRFFNSNVVSTSYPAGVSSAPPAGQGCELTAASGTTLSAYMQPDVNSGVFLTAAAGQYFESLGRSLNGWFAIDPPAIPNVPYGVNRLRWIPPGANLRGRGNCPSDVIPDTGGGDAGNQTYTNAEIGFALDYPAGWSEVNQGSYVDFIAPDGRTFEVLFGVPGSVTTPEQAAADCKNSPLCIGDRKILLEQPVPLPDGLSGIRLELSASLTKPDTTPAVYVFTVISNRALVFRGFGSTSPTYFNSVLNSLRLLRF